MFFIFEYVIIFFPEHTNSRVFWCNSKRNHANRQNKTSEKISEDFRKIKNEYSRGIKRLYRGSNYVPSPKTSYMKANTQKDEKNRDLCTGTHSWVPRAWEYTKFLMNGCPEHDLGSTSIDECGAHLIFNKVYTQNWQLSWYWMIGCQ